MGNVFYFDWEVDLIEWLQKTIGSFGQTIAKTLSAIGGETVTLLVLLVVLFCYKKEAGKRCGFAMVAASMWFPMIKDAVLRLRPYMAHPDRVEMLSTVHTDADPMDVVQQGYSFPSGHSANAVSLYGSIAREIRKKWMWWAAVILPLLIGLSRFAVGVHYPTDVLAGWAVGLAAVLFCALLEKKVKTEWLRSAILIGLTIPGIFWCTSRDYFTALGLMIGMAAVFPYERKYVGFQDTRNKWAMILRVAGAFMVYGVLNIVLKLPFSEAWLNSGTLGANLVRSARYAVLLFVLIGVYPRIFPAFEKLGKSAENREDSDSSACAE